jgi:hypothetical protein
MINNLRLMLADAIIKYFNVHLSKIHYLTKNAIL